MRRPALILCALAGIGFSDAAQAGTWTVGRDPTDCPGGCDFHDFTTGGGLGGGIQSAMVSPSVFAGDTVLVYPRVGVLSEDACLGSVEGEPDNEFSIKINIKSGVVLKAASGPGTVCIKGGAGSEPAIFFINTSEATVVDGFRLTWDSTVSGLGGAISCYVASGVIKNCIFEDCLAGIGAGVYEFLSDVRLENNLFINNQCVSGGGTVALSSSPATVVNNTFHGNIAPFGSQGASFYSSDSGHTLHKNIISESIGASAFYCSGTNPGTVTCNIFWNNPVGVGGGTCADQTGTGGNQNADPGYCNVALQDFNVCADSPALIGPCGVIGYTPPSGGCGACLTPTHVADSLESATWGKIKALYR